MIELLDVHKELGGRKVLDGLSLAVETGKTTVIIGRSGAGKSVTLKHIVGLLKPDRGLVLVDGTNVAQAPPQELAQVRRRIGMVFQSAALINWLSVKDNVALPLRETTEMPECEIMDRVTSKLALVELADAADKMPGELSGGMRKRVGLARALVTDPSLILYDEPTSGLDPIMSARINEIIRGLRQKLGVTAIVVTHDIASAYFVGDRIAMLYDGRIIEEGTPQEIRDSSNPIVRQFIEGTSTGPLKE